MSEPTWWVCTSCYNAFEGDGLGNKDPGRHWADDEGQDTNCKGPFVKLVPASDLTAMREALEALNQLRSNIVATQSASWSNAVYPLVAILNAAGFELREDVSMEERAQHFDCYGGAGGYPGALKREPVASAINAAHRSHSNQESDPVDG